MAVFPPPSAPLVDLPPQPDGVPYPTGAWPTSAPPPEVAAPLATLVDEAFGPTVDDEATVARFGRSLAFVAVHRGRLVAEAYGPTAGPDEPLISWSMAKSMTQALVGVLVAEGRLDLDRPVDLPGWDDPADPRSRITLDHLLRMVPGTEFKEDYTDETVSHCIDMLFGDGNPDMAAYTAALPALTEPDTVFNYASGTTVLVCRLLADVVGAGPAFEAWMREVLLDPLGIEARLTFDDAGTWVGSSFLHTTAREFAKFGLLYLRDGVWDGRRLLPDGWVDYARTLRAADDETGRRYGSHWWIHDTDDRVFWASGYETQRIIVDPVADLVLVRLGKTDAEVAPDVDDWLERIRLLFHPG
ncbi:MAG: serine hydrolase [Actinomycetota bacterium]